MNDDLLFSAVRRGDIQTLQSHLSTTENSEIYFNRIHKDEGPEQNCTLLMIACLNKHEDTVRILLERLQLDLEVLNDIQLTEKDQPWTFRSVTVLWAAAAINHLGMVKLFVEYGARVNHTTSTNSTALRCACCNSNVEMARYLVENGADVRIAKIHNETNLIASVFNEDFEMTGYFVDELGCDVNECIDDGRSPLYVAAERGSFVLVQFLLRHGARNFPASCDQMSPLILAAEKRRKDLVDLIAPHCSLLEQIEAEEMLGSAFACDEHGTCNLDKTLECFHRALELRSKYTLPKVQRLSTVEVFDNRQECQNIEELAELQFNQDRIYTEALLVRERILGPTNIKYFHSLRYRGAVLADNAHHQQGIMFWLYELQLRRQHSIAMDTDDLRQWASILSDMMYISSSIPIVAWQTAVTVIIDELTHKNTDFDDNLHTLLFLITIASQILSDPMASPTDRKVFYRHIFSTVQRQYRSQLCGSSLLHLSLNNLTTANDYFIDRSYTYPCLNTARILIQCGADVNASDALRNTPLHVLVSQSNTFNKSFVQLLSDAGAHLDYVNALRETPSDLTSNKRQQQMLKTQTKLSLKCACARLIQISNVPMDGRITTSLIKFVERH